MKKEILKKLNRDIIKSAKRGDFHYYWDISGVPKDIVGEIMVELEKEGKVIKSKGTDYKIIMW